MNCLNAKMMTDYFEMLEAVIIKHNFLNNLSQIYNMDETLACLWVIRHPRLLLREGKRRCVVELQAKKSDYSDSLCQCNRTYHTPICYL